MKRLWMTLALVAFGVNAALSGELVNVDAETRLAVQGYDPVAFFTEGEAIKGSESVTFEHHGAVYRFASEANRAAFAEEPAKYAPAFGGYCAFGASVNKLFPVQIDTWQIAHGRLFFQKDQDVKKMFEENPEENFRKAVANWPKLVEEHGR